MRIAVVTPNPPSEVGGVERFTKYISEMLINDGYSVDIICKDLLANYQNEWLLRSQIREAYLAFRLGNIAKNRNLKNRYDWYIANGMFGWNLPHDKTINVFHGTYLGFHNCTKNSRRIISKVQERIIYKPFEVLSTKSRYTVAVSDFTHEQLRKYYGKSDVIVIPNAIDTKHFKPYDRMAARKCMNLISNKKLILFLGRWEEAKGNKIFQEIISKHSDLLLGIYAGPGVINHENIISLGSVDYNHLPLLYSACDVLLFPSKFENCSYVLLEAMACGLPFVTSATGHALTLAKEIEFLKQYVVNQGDIVNYEKALFKLLNNDSQYSFFRTMIIKIANDEYALEGWYYKFKNLLLKKGEH